VSIAVIINPIAGRARRPPASERALRAAAVIDRAGEQAEVFITERAGHARELAVAAVGNGARLVVAWGGDGTVNEIASALAFGDVPLAIIPAGSGNGLARELGIDRLPERALANAIRAEPAVVDLGELGGHLFVNVAGAGIDAYVAAQFNAVANTSRGLSQYLRIGGRALLSYAPLRYTVTADNQRTAVRAVAVVIANSAQYGNGARIAPGARMDDGELDLVIVEERFRLATLMRTPHLFRGTLARVPGCSIRRIREATIGSAEPMLFHVDGEPIENGTELHARVHPGALKICVK
jgi:YegS/Rv2252/BmrU family lipid kinase